MGELDQDQRFHPHCPGAPRPRHPGNQDPEEGQGHAGCSDRAARRLPGESPWAPSLCMKNHKSDLENQKSNLENQKSNRENSTAAGGEVQREPFEWQLRPSNIKTEIEVIPRPTTVFKAPHCARCGNALVLEDFLKEAVTENGNWETLQASGALIISFEGGYGMAVDPIGGDDFRWIICELCAHQFLDDNPWLQAPRGDETA